MAGTSRGSIQFTVTTLEPPPTDDVRVAVRGDGPLGNWKRSLILYRCGDSWIGTFTPSHDKLATSGIAGRKPFNYKYIWHPGRCQDPELWEDRPTNRTAFYNPCTSNDPIIDKNVSFPSVCSAGHAHRYEQRGAGASEVSRSYREQTSVSSCRTSQGPPRADPCSTGGDQSITGRTCHPEQRGNSSSEVCRQARAPDVHMTDPCSVEGQNPQRAHPRAHAAAVGAASEAISRLLDPPDAQIFDPRYGGGRKVSVMGFYYPGHKDHCDKVFNIEFCGNFYDVSGLDYNARIEIEVPAKSGKMFQFITAEGAFQACKFGNYPEKVREFVDASGEKAFRLKKMWSGYADPRFSEYGSNWKAMLEVLRAKFKNQKLAEWLLATGDAFLIEHKSAGVHDERIWSDNHDGEGKNWLGMQLMILRDELRQKGREDVPGKRPWIRQLQHWFDIETGKPQNDNPEYELEWQRLVKEASTVVREASRVRREPSQVGREASKAGQEAPAQSSLCFRPGCTGRSFNGKPGEFCSIKCRKNLLCVRPGCSKDSWKDRSSHFCDRSCRDQADGYFWFTVKCDNLDNDKYVCAVGEGPLGDWNIERAAHLYNEGHGKWTGFVSTMGRETVQFKFIICSKLGGETIWEWASKGKDGNRTARRGQLLQATFDRW